jgi:DNA-binding HxlR family transcriptional regulator
VPGWSLIVIRDLMFSNRSRFRLLLNGSEEGIASNILADRLNRLVAAGCCRGSEPQAEANPQSDGQGH